jgi:hypothetical protein
LNSNLHLVDAIDRLFRSGSVAIVGASPEGGYVTNTLVRVPFRLSRAVFADEGAEGIVRQRLLAGINFIESSPETKPFWEDAAAGLFVLP